MAAKHKSTLYKALPIPNPLQEGQDRAYSEILGHAIKETNLWRKVFFVNIGVFILALILFLTAISQQQIIPVLVNVMPSGEAQFLGEVRHGNLQIPEAAVHFEIRRFVTNLRTISTDHQVVFNNIDDLFSMATASYVPILRQKLIANSPFEEVGRIRRSVEIESVLNITERSYAINWREIVIDLNARQTTTRFRAVITVQLLTPTEHTIRRNPLGIHIENFEMTEL